LIFLDDIHDRSDPAVLPRVNPYENYDEKKFREWFRLLKRVVLHVLSGVLFITRRQNCQAQYSPNTAYMTSVRGAHSCITWNQSAVGSTS